jgi:phosphate transport system protein
MGLYAEQAVAKSFDAFIKKDAETARLVIDNDKNINAREVEIDNLGLKLLALDQPMAKDLRIIVGCMGMATDLERIGDEASNVAENTILMSNLSPQLFSPLMDKLAFMVRDMFAKALIALKDDDAALATDVCRMDIAVNELYYDVVKRALDITSCDKTLVELVSRRIMAAKSIERIGNHAANIAETVIFILKGVNVKHRCMPF